MIDRFKERHDDLPLSLLGRDACKDMLRFWCQRPPVKNRKSGKFDGPPIAVSTARHHRKELDRFFKWLDSSDEFAWKLPRGFTTLDRAISPTEEEFAQRLSVVQKDVYSVQELAELNRNATVLERLFLFIGLNCGMGAAELGRLKSQDILLFHKHEFQDRLGFESTSRDSFIRYLRPKTSVFGEWLLWPETVQLVQWGLERSRQIGSELIFVSEKAAKKLGRQFYGFDIMPEYVEMARQRRATINEATEVRDFDYFREELKMILEDCLEAGGQPSKQHVQECFKIFQGSQAVNFETTLASMPRKLRDFYESLPLTLAA